VKLADLPQVRALSASEKLQLMDELWQDVARDLDNLEVSGDEKRLLDERWAAFLRDPSAALTLEQIQKKVRALRG
jgi:putative addiction module component (TIGR02574 family)